MCVCVYYIYIYAHTMHTYMIHNKHFFTSTILTSNMCTTNNQISQSIKYVYNKQSNKSINNQNTMLVL